MMNENMICASSGSTPVFRPKPKTDETQREVKEIIDLVDFLPIPKQSEILIAPVGGVGRVGMNWTLYGHDGEWILVDAGIGFDDDKTSKKILVPDTEFIKSISSSISALIVTHAHEDHIGAIHRFWPEVINVPIYASEYAAGVIGRRFEECNNREQIVLNSFKVGSRFSIGKFEIETIRLTHSVPEPVALKIKTALGNVIHSGDWKLDEYPVVGMPTDMEALKQAAKEGVLALVGDSTNADRPLPRTSEQDVQDAFMAMFKSCPKKIVLSCFSSNLARIHSAIIAAKACGRMAALAGRSMQENEKIARSLGILPDHENLLSDPSHLQGLDDKEILLICTGAQGEEQGALSKLARGYSRYPKIGYGDCIIISSRAIPGNEEAINNLVESFILLGATVMTGKDTFEQKPLHVSGHAGSDELELMYQMLSPEYAIPVHGERKHLASHKKIAKKYGCKVPDFEYKEKSIIRISK